MSDSTNSKTEVFEVLPGLPGVGPLPEQFTITGQGTHHEGFVVRFHAHLSESWVGNFQGGLSGYSSAIAHPDGRTVIVVSGGQAYQVDPASRSLLRHFGGMITDVIACPAEDLLVFSDGIRMWAEDATGQRWQTERISWDGIRDLAVESDSIVGESYDPTNRDRPWSRFSVCLKTGTVKGGSYKL